MLMAHPALLNQLVEQYEALSALHAEDGGAEVPVASAPGAREKPFG